MKTGV